MAIDTADTGIDLEVEVRGEVRTLRWDEAGMTGDVDAVERVLRTAERPSDAVTFLRAARLAFGERMTAHLGEPAPRLAG